MARSLGIKGAGHSQLLPTPPEPERSITMSLATTFRQRWEFARHVPARKLAKRAWLSVKRQLDQRIGRFGGALVPSASQPGVSATAPEPVFPRRSLGVSLEGGDIEVDFLNERRRFSLPIDWHSTELSDRRKQLWRMNLHYHEFVENLADDRFCAIVVDWIRANPRHRPRYWLDSWNSYTLSIRVVVWMQQIVARRLRQNADFVAIVLPSIVAQIRFLERNLEEDIGGNHLVKNIKALFWAGAFFDGPEAQHFANSGRRLLSAELGQILADGMHYERSPSYHTQVFADLVEIRHAHGRDPLDGKLDAALWKMAQVVADMKHPDGGPALFNDAGLTMAYAPSSCLSAYAQVLGCPAPTETEGAFALPDAGYFGFRSAGPCLIVDCGLIAPHDLPAHGHGDVLSFELSWGGYRFIVDQGVFEYNAGAKRAAARTAANHNTLCIQGADQADFFGAFRVGRRPRPSVLEYHGSGDNFRLCGTHDGFAHLPGSPQHWREVEADAATVRIHDRIVGNRARPAVVSLLVHPEVTIETGDEGVVLTREDVRLCVTADLAISVEDACWWPDMGVEVKTHRLRLDLPLARDEVTLEMSPCVA